MLESTKKLIDLQCEEILAKNMGLVRESDFTWGFRAGVNAFNKVVWHNKEEKPTRTYECIVIADNTSLKVDNKIHHMQEHERWAYLKDLLPDIKSPVMPRDSLSGDGTTKDVPTY